VRVSGNDFARSSYTKIIQFSTIVLRDCVFFTAGEKRPPAQILFAVHLTHTWKIFCAGGKINFPLFAVLRMNGKI
jgi:hypothetical protein